VGLVYDSRGLPGVTTVRLGVAEALHPGSSTRCEGGGGLRQDPGPTGVGCGR
jgi:hypothetical protein